MTRKEIELAALLFRKSYYDGDMPEIERKKAILALSAAQAFYEEANKKRKQSFFERLFKKRK